MVSMLSVPGATSPGPKSNTTRPEKPRSHGRTERSAHADPHRVKAPVSSNAELNQTLREARPHERPPSERPQIRHRVKRPPVPRHRVEHQALREARPSRTHRVGATTGTESEHLGAPRKLALTNAPSGATPQIQYHADAATGRRASPSRRTQPRDPGGEAVTDEDRSDRTRPDGRNARGQGNAPAFCTPAPTPPVADPHPRNTPWA